MQKKLIHCLPWSVSDPSVATTWKIWSRIPASNTSSQSPHYSPYKAQYRTEQCWTEETASSRCFQVTARQRHTTKMPLQDIGMDNTNTNTKANVRMFSFLPINSYLSTQQEHSPLWSRRWRYNTSVLTFLSFLDACDAAGLISSPIFRTRWTFLPTRWSSSVNTTVRRSGIWSVTRFVRSPSPTRRPWWLYSDAPKRRLINTEHVCLKMCWKKKCVKCKL